MLAGYCLWRDGARIVACDGGGPGRPRLRESGGLAEGGRGLQVVNALAARWDCFLLAGTRVVWCDFGQPLPAAPGDAWAWLRLVLPACDLSPMAGTPVHTGADDRHAITGPTTIPDRYPLGYFTECRAAGLT